MPAPNPATRYQHSGNARVTTLASGITAASTSCTLSNSAGWPDGSVGPFFAVLSGGLSNQEKVLCSSRVGDVLNFSGGVAGRGQDGTSAQDHNAGEGNVYPCVSAFEIDLLNAHAAASSQVHGVAGAVLGTTDAQNVTNKSFDNSNNYAGGGLSGTFTGSPTYSGAPTFSGAALFTGDPIFQDAAAGGIALLARVSGDGTPRFAVNGDGKIEWGPGNAARDVNLYRSAANVLKTDDALDIQAGGTIAGTWAGAPEFSGVAAFTGVPVFRKVNTTDVVAHFRANADGNPRLSVRADGRLEWGPGSGAVDTNLFRDAADVLRTNDSLVVDGNLTATGFVYQTYTPALTADTTNPTLGSGSVAKGWYFQLGKLVIGGFFIKFGTSGAAAGSGIYHVSLPVAASTSPDQFASGATSEGGNTLGAMGFRDDSAPASESGQNYLFSSTAVTMRSGGGLVTNTSPWTWANLDILHGTFAYIAA